MSNSKLSLAIKEFPKSITGLPIEIVEIIAQQCDFLSYLNLSSTCHTMRNYMTDSSFYIEGLFMNVNEKTPCPKIMKKSISGYRFIAECRNPHRYVRTLLRAMHGDVRSILLRLSDKFSVKRLDNLTHVIAIEWTITNKDFNYKKCLDRVCLPPNLKMLTLNVAGMEYGDEDWFDIDSIKEIVNAKGIQVIIKLPFPSTLFTKWTNNIDNVTILMDNTDPDLDRYYQSNRKMTFLNNKTLTINGILIDNFVAMDFKNVDKVSFVNFKGTQYRREGFDVTYIEPSRLRFIDFDGLYVDYK
jgi:hypothetical protein